MAGNPYLSEATSRYLGDLADHNTKEWFEENRARYEAEWLMPAQQFIEALSASMLALNPPHKAEAKVNKSIRRIHRDVRFSADKRPFDPRLHLVFWTGDHPNRSPAIHLIMHRDGIGAGAGQWAMTPQQLEAYQQAVLDDRTGKALEAAVEQAGKAGCSLTEETLKRLPKGLPKDTGRDTLLKRKGLVVRTQDRLPSRLIYGEAGLAFARELAARLAPVNGWLLANVP